ncbi:uncharacterized protein LOC105216379 isoform X2 [Zeugodacus cucurbitae]|uniref:uncharacterized protein LOC105216379 isoform X2 n=1 Tax=Zeugodacus cucurbitae TaxID=28588 RepID=UPI0023D96BD5|nr:uncharacterized protein LOC105216379 isoform X2 [Zeugodacus cucurbitae]
MKICVSIVLLMLLCPGGCPVYDFDLRTIEQPSQFADGLKLAADLNSEFNQGIMNFHVLNNNDGCEADNTCQLDDLPVEPEEGPTRRLKYLRRVEEEDMSNTEINEFVGSNLFDSTRKNCFSPEDLNLMAARRDFEYLLPKDLPKCLLNDDMLNMLLNYFYNGNEMIQRMNDASRKVVERAYYDMLGGYLRSYMLPVAKYSFYGGKASLRVVSSVVELYQQCKSFLNTNGNGWRMPILLEEMDNVRVDSIRGSECGADGNGAGGGPSGCARLEMLPTSDGEENVMLVALPKLEADCIENGLSNIWLPFRKRRNYDLRSLKSAYVILRFYETVTRCYQSQSMPQEAFNCKFIAWINENLKPHLSDEEFYPGLGGVLRIVEKLRKGRKALDLDDDQALNQRKDDLSGTRFGDTVGAGDNSKSDDGFSDMELAQKALEYKIKEKARQTMINSKRWFEKSANDNRQLQSRKICDKSKDKSKAQQSNKAQQGQHGAHTEQNQTHKAKKTKCKSKGGKHGGGGSLIKLTSEEQKHYLKYLCCIIGLILLILLIILLVAMLLRYRKRRRKTEPKPKPPKKKRKCPAWCNFFLCRKKPADEEIVIKPETKSVIATQPHRRASTSTSSLACQPAAKCIPCSKRATKESESAPIIETTSLDYYSSSEPESKVRQKAKKGKQKVVTIDEKKRKKSASPSPTKTKPAPAKSKAAPAKSKSTPTKSRLSGGTELKCSSSSDSTKRLGIQRTLQTDNKKK